PAIAAPMPTDAPVTSATLSFSLIALSFSSARFSSLETRPCPSAAAQFARRRLVDLATGGNHNAIDLLRPFRAHQPLGHVLLHTPRIARLRIAITAAALSNGDQRLAIADRHHGALVERH